MDPREFRFGGGRVLFEIFMLGVAVFIGGSILHEDLRSRSMPHAGMVVPGSWLVFGWAAGLLTVLRWRSRIRMDRDAIELRRSRTRVAVRIDWDQVDELFLLGPERFEVRGAGKRIHFSGAFPGAPQARQMASSRLGGLRDLLRNRALQDGSLTFRMPGGLLRAHLAYLIVLLVLSAATAAVLAPFISRWRSGGPVFLVLFGGFWIWRLRRKSSSLGTRVTLYRDGLLVRRLDGQDKVAWSDIDRTEWDEKGGLVIVLGAGRRIGLPASLGNIAVLEEFIEESRRRDS